MLSKMFSNFITKAIIVTINKQITANMVDIPVVVNMLDTEMYLFSIFFFFFSTVHINKTVVEIKTKC